MKFLLKRFPLCMDFFFFWKEVVVVMVEVAVAVVGCLFLCARAQSLLSAECRRLLPACLGSRPGRWLMCGCQRAPAHFLAGVNNAFHRTTGAKIRAWGGREGHTRACPQTPKKSQAVANKEKS